MFDKWKLNGYFFKVHLNSLDHIYSSHFTSDTLNGAKALWGTAQIGRGCVRLADGTADREDLLLFM